MKMDTMTEAEKLKNWQHREGIAVFGLFAAVHDFLKATEVAKQAEAILRMQSVHGDIQDLRNEAILRSIRKPEDST